MEVRNLFVKMMAVVAIAMLSLFAFAACGGDDDGDGGDGGNGAPTATEPADGEEPTEAPDEQSSEDVTACDLVTKEEAAELLGEPVDDADTGAASCVYSAESIDSFASVGLGLFSFETDGAANTSFDEGKAQVDSPEDLSGLGDEAYWDPLFGSVDIRQGRHFVTISVAFADGDSASAEGMEAALALAETVLSRLP